MAAKRRKEIKAEKVFKKYTNDKAQKKRDERFLNKNKVFVDYKKFGDNDKKLVITDLNEDDEIDSFSLESICE